MLDIEISPAFVAVAIALSGASPRDRFCRVIRCRVVFPDIGHRFVAQVGFLRYGDELSLVGPEATEHELTLVSGLTNHL